MICHDSVFDTEMHGLHTDLSTGINDFDGPGFPWDNNGNLEHWNPARPDLLLRWRNAPPTLVIHSEKDYRCPITEGLGVFKALQFHGVPSRYLYFSDESHWVTKPENSLVWHHTVFDWVERWIGSGPTNERASESSATTG